VEGSPTPKNRYLCMAIITRSFAFMGRGGQETWAGGRVVSIMRDPRVGNPHNVHLSCSPVSVELCPGGPGSCMAGPGPWRVPRNPGEPNWDEAPPLLVHVYRDVLDTMDYA
jgi:hypothetical protein